MSRVIRLRRLGGVSLIFAAVSACGDSQHNSGSGAEGGAGSDVGSAGGDAGSGEGDAPSQAGASDNGAGGSGTASPETGACVTHADCDDGKYCNGREQCLPELPGSDIKVCMVPEWGPCGVAACDEAAKACDCAHGDDDDDGFRVEGCVNAGEKADCDDTDGARNPARKEKCDLSDATHDEDCNEATYADASEDVDGDSFLDAKCANYSTYQAIGVSPTQRKKASQGSDCDDGDDQSHPGAPEVCDGLDNNCNGTPDELWGTPLEERRRYYEDRDGDYWGNPDRPFETSCNIPPAGYALNPGDCDDTNPQVSRDRAEVCNGIDDDCDKTIDQPLKPGTLMLDEPYDGVTEFECKQTEPGEASWIVKRCPSGRLNCDNRYLNACETIGTTLCNCHACDTACRFSCGEEGCEEIQAVSAGLLHTCVLAQSESVNAQGKVACMGRNEAGQLGLPIGKDKSVAVTTPDLTGIISVASGRFHSCAVNESGSVFCWGSNEFGQVGSDTSVLQADHPLRVGDIGRPAIRVNAGAYHSCAIYEGGLPACWGKGVSGQLGNGYEESFYFPVPVIRMLANGSDYENLSGVTQIVAGTDHSCALAGGKVECWGSNETMQLGVDPSLLSGAATATAVSGLEDVVVEEIEAAGVNTCARAGSRVYCWGGNVYHQLAQEQGLMGGVTPIDLPEDIIDITVGVFFSCALRATGDVYCWGINLHGEIGTVGTSVTAPRQLSLTGVERLFSGNGNHICASRGSAGVWCWGKNDFGQLGNGSISEEGQPEPSRMLPLDGVQPCALGE